MASRYWVGGTASWDATAGTKWAATSGGAGGESVPTSADDVFFDANSGSGTVTVVEYPTYCKSLVCTGFLGTLNGNGNRIIVAGNVTFSSGMTVTTVDIEVSGGTCNLTSAGKTLRKLIMTGGSSISLVDAVVCSSELYLKYGTFTTNNFSVTAPHLYAFGNDPRTFNLGSSTITLTGDNGFLLTYPSNVSISGTSTIKLTSTWSKSFDGGGLTYYNLWHAPGGGAGALTITGNNTFANFKDDGTAEHQIIFPASGTQTVSSFTVSGASTSARIKLRSSVSGTRYTLSDASGTNSCNYLDIKDCAATGGASWVANNSLNSGNNTGWSGLPLLPRRKVPKVSSYAVRRAAYH